MSWKQLVSQLLRFEINKIVYFFLVNNSWALQCAERVLFCLGMKCKNHTSKNLKHKQRLFTLLSHGKTLGIFTV